MSRKDFFLVAGTAAISSLLTYLACGTATAPPGATQQEITLTAERHAASSNYPAESHPRTTAPPRASGASNAPPPATSPEVVANSTVGTAPDPALAMKTQQEAGARLARLVDGAGKAGPGSIGTKIENRFYQEDWNQDWAGSRESNIRTLFESSDDLEGIAPQQVTCRSRNCQVVLSATSADEARQVSQKFMQVARAADLGMKNQLVSFFPDVSTGRVVFYLSEDGNTDLFR